MMADNNIVDLGAWKGKLQKNGRGGHKKNVTNLLHYLQNLREFGASIRWNELAQRVEWKGEPVTDSDLITMRLILEAQDFEPPTGDLLTTVIRHARDNAYHPVRDYLQGLRWDGTKRLNYWLEQCLGAAKTDFNRLVGRKTLIAAVARAFRPGCKVDTVLVLEGDQGIKKSSGIETLFGETWTAGSVNLFDQHNKMVMSMMGAWCVELAEFTAITKSGEKGQAAVKGLISTRTDRVVLPYAKTLSEHPRQCIFFGTINPGETGYLTDTTGNRRYWPVKVTKADTDLITDRRDQLWAEAHAAYRDGERWWLEGGENDLAESVVSEREEADAWAEVMQDKLAGVMSTSIAAAMREIGIPVERMGKRELDRAAKVLRRIGFKSRPGKETGEDGKRHSILIFERPT